MTWPALPPSCVVAEVDGVPVLFDQGSGATLVLDGLAAFVLRHRDHFADLDDAVGALAGTFEADSTTVAADLRRLARRVDRLGRAEERPIVQLGPRARAPRGLDVSIWRFDAVGRAVEVACHDDELSAVIGPLLAAHPCSSDMPVHRFDVWIDGAGVTVTQDGALVYERVSLAHAVSGLFSVITAVTMFEALPSPLLLHAAAVALDDGAIVLGGGSNEGKSTTTIELMFRGFGYLTDEIVGLEPASGRVTGLARPIGLEGDMQQRWRHLRPPWLADGDPGPRWAVPPAQVGDVVEAGSLRLFVVLDFAASGPTSVAALEAVEAVAAIGTLSYNRESITAAALGELGDLLGRTPAVRVRHRGAPDAADAVADAYARLVGRGVD